jgi:hypothetical protein
VVARRLIAAAPALVPAPVFSSHEKSKNLELSFEQLTSLSAVAAHAPP